MNENPEIRYRVYRIHELRNWLMNNVSNGLSEYAIAPTRAYSLINNPCAKEDDPAIVVVFDGERPIGYSAVYADEYISGNTQGRFYWGTTEWIEPEYRGKGIAGKMMRTLKDAVGIERYIGLDSSVASVKLDQKQGASICLYDRIRYQFAPDSSIRGYLRWKWNRHINQKALRRFGAYDFKNQYVNHIDERTFRFIIAHARNDLFLRQREMFNWMLHYPFFVGADRDSKAMYDACEFGSTFDKYKIEAVKVYVTNELVGFYIVSQTNHDRTLRYLYYEETHKDEVFASVCLNLLKPGIERIYFMSSDLQTFMQEQGIKHMNRNTYLDNIALTLPPGMSVDENLHIQGGDGDMFC